MLDTDAASALGRQVARVELRHALRFRRLSGLLAGLALVHPLASVLAQSDWRADLLTHFQEPAFAVTLLALLAAWLRRQRWLAVPLLALAVTQAVPLCKYSLTNP